MSVRRSGYPEAAEHLKHLQSILGRQREWVLSDVIDVIRQALLSQPEATAFDQLLASDAALSSAFEQLLRWGTPAAASKPGGSDSPDGHGKHGTRHRLRVHWLQPGIRSGKRLSAARGELRLKWVEIKGCFFGTPGSAERGDPRFVHYDYRTLLLLLDLHLLTEPQHTAQDQEPACCPTISPRSS